MSREKRATSCAGAIIVALAAAGSNLARVPPVAAASLVVNTTADGVGASTCNGAGICTLRHAITLANANPGSTITLPAGDYARDPVQGALVINASMTITGAGAGSTFINGSGAPDPETRVFQINGPAAVTMSGVTVRNGHNGRWGGGIDLERASLSLTDSIVSGNFLGGNAAGEVGAGIFMSTAGDPDILTLTNTTVTDNHINTGGGGGGGILSYGGTVTLTDSSVSGNSAANGAGIDNSGSSMTLTRTVVASNLVGLGSWGGINNEAGSLTLAGSTLNDNGGGGINNAGAASIANTTISGNGASGINNSGTLTISDTTISGNNNSGFLGSGGGISNSGTLTISDTTISGNQNGSFLGGGGGISSSGTLAMANTTISGNSANQSGGGVYQSGGTVTATNSTIADNSAPAGSGIAAVPTTSASTTTLANTILANSPTTNCLGGITSGGNNLDTGLSCGFVSPTTGDRENLAANLGPLQDNGGPTQTQAPLAGSPAIDGGSSTICANAPVAGLDQRGLPRFPASDPACDIGAVEVQPSSTPIAVYGDAAAVRVERLSLAGGAPVSQSLCEAGPVLGVGPGPTYGACGTGPAPGGLTLGDPYQAITPDGHGGVTSDSSIGSLSLGVGGTSLIDAAVLRATSSTACSVTGQATPGQSKSSIARLTVAGTTVATQPMGSRIIFNPTGKNPITVYGNPITINPTGGRVPMAVVTLNYSRHDLATTRQVSSPVEVEFPAGGPLAKLIVGRVFLAYASSGCR